MSMPFMMTCEEASIHLRWQQKKAELCEPGLSA